MNARLWLVSAAFVVCFGVIGLRLVAMGLTTPDQAAIARYQPAPLATRADLLDRQGRLLATTVVAPQVTADPRAVRDPSSEADALAAVLGADAGRLRTLLASKRHHVVLARDVGPRELERVRRLGLPAVRFEYRSARIYPNGQLAAHALGHVGIDNVGLDGAERAFDERLRGAAREPVRLSLDIGVQAAVEDELAAALDRYQAKAGAAIVMDARSGELLALASLPTFDPHQPTASGDDARKDRNVTQTFELGSVFKLLTVGLGLQSGVIGIHDHVDATNPLKIGRFTINDYRGKRRPLSVAEALMYSSNIANGRIGMMAGAERWQRYLRDLGLDRALALETGTGARPQTPKRWPNVTVATVSFGHGIAVTPLHLTTAVSALLTDGRLVEPTLLARSEEQAPAGPQVVDDTTIKHMRGLAYRVAVEGSGKKALVDGYLIGGKTGTAEKVDASGRYRPGLVRSSFVAAFPIHEPRYVVYVLLDEPVGEGDRPDLYYGSWTAAPAAGRMIARIGPLLGVSTSPAGMVADLRRWGGAPPDVPALTAGEERSDATRPTRG
ncbi:MAG: penicillin-binding protein 2 [Pseudomonadota bacterium]